MTDLSLPNSWVCQYSEKEMTDNGLEWFALFEKPDYSLTQVILPPSIGKREKHTVYSIYPFYEDIGIPHTYSDQFHEFQDTYLKYEVPNHNSDRPLSSVRSTLGDFTWEDYPEQYKESSTYYQNYPLEYKEIFSDIATWSILHELFDQFPQCFGDDGYTTTLYLNSTGDKLLVHTGIALTNGMRDIYKSLFDLPSPQAYNLTEKIEIGEVTLVQDFSDTTENFKIGSIKVDTEYQDLLETSVTVEEVNSI